MSEWNPTFIKSIEPLTPKDSGFKPGDTLKCTLDGMIFKPKILVSLFRCSALQNLICVDQLTRRVQVAGIHAGTVQRRAFLSIWACRPGVNNPDSIWGVHGHPSIHHGELGRWEQDKSELWRLQSWFQSESRESGAGLEHGMEGCLFARFCECLIRSVYTLLQ